MQRTHLKMATVGKGVFLLLFLLFGEFILIEASHNEAHCRMEDFPVQKNFSEERFQGKWYEVSWIIHPWILPEWNYYDYIHDYTKTSYGFSIIADGRWPFNATECVETVYPKLFRTGENAKYLFELPGPDGLINSTQWVVDTDYNNYALVIGCREVASNGTCVGPDGWLWTRCQNKPKKHVEYMERMLPKFCLSKDQFHTSYHNTDSCSLEGAGYRIQSALVTSITAAILSMVVFMYLH